MSARGRSVSRGRATSLARAIATRERSATPALQVLDDLEGSPAPSPIKQVIANQYPRRFKFNDNDYPNKVMAIRSTITDAEYNRTIGREILIPLAKLGTTMKEIIERTWPDGNPPRPIDWYDHEQPVDPKERTKVKAIIAHLGADEAAEQCINCKAGYVFQTCRQNPLWTSQNNACTSCSFHGKPLGCSHNPSFVEKAGSQIQPKVSRRTPRKSIDIGNKDSTKRPAPKWNLATLEEVDSPPSTSTAAHKTAPSAPAKSTKQGKKSSLNTPVSTPSKPHRKTGWTTHTSSYSNIQPRTDNDDDDDDLGMGGIFDRGHEVHDLDQFQAPDNEIAGPSGIEKQDVRRKHQGSGSAQRHVEAQPKILSSLKQDGELIIKGPEDMTSNPDISLNVPAILSRPGVYTSTRGNPYEKGETLEVQLPESAYEYREILKPGMTRRDYWELMKATMEDEFQRLETVQLDIEGAARMAITNPAIYQARLMVLGSRLAHAPHMPSEMIDKFHNLPPEEELMAARSLRLAADYFLYHALPREQEVVGREVLRHTRDRLAREQAEDAFDDRGFESDASAMEDHIEEDAAEQRETPIDTSGKMVKRELSPSTQEHIPLSSAGTTALGKRSAEDERDVCRGEAKKVKLFDDDTIEHVIEDQPIKSVATNDRDNDGGMLQDHENRTDGTVANDGADVGASVLPSNEQIDLTNDNMIGAAQETSTRLESGIVATLNDQSQRINFPQMSDDEFLATFSRELRNNGHQGQAQEGPQE